MDFIRFIEVVKSQYKQDLHCSRKKLLHNFAGASCKTLLFQYISVSRLIFIWHVKSSILKLTVQNTRKDQQYCDLVRDSVEMEMSEKLSLFGYIVSFLNEKSYLSGFLICMILDFSKERHISDGFCVTLWCSVHSYSDSSGSE